MRKIKARKNEKVYWLSCSPEGIRLWNTCPTPYYKEESRRHIAFYYGDTMLAYWSEEIFEELYPDQRIERNGVRRVVIRGRQLIVAKLR